MQVIGVLSISDNGHSHFVVCFAHIVFKCSGYCVVPLLFALIRLSIMSTFANRPNNSVSPLLSESDNDDDNEQNSSFNQQNESMIHKVKDVVSKFLHPSFLFAASGDTTRPKRKRSTSIEEKVDEKQREIPTKTAITNGHSTASKSKDHRRPVAGDEPQLTDDEDNSNGRDVPSAETDRTEIEQQKKRRRTANYQNMISTTTTNGNHEDERTSPSLPSTNSVSSLSDRRTIDSGLKTANTTPILLQTSIDQNSNEGLNRMTASRQRFNLASTNRGLSANHDLSQSPLFSVGVRKPMETTMSPNRTTTNLKSNTNDFSGNFLLATGLANRSQSTTAQYTPQSSSSTLTNRLLSAERQMFGVNYASINSRRLPYIERLRRRTLQDCIRLNRTLDSEPLSISTIEEHTSTTASPVRKPVKTSEKECGIQCNISTTDSSMEPSKKIQRTFPPADIRNEALSVPMNEKVSATNQIESSIQTNSSITIESIRPISDINKPKVLGDVTPFAWPKFARAQEDFAKRNPEKCRADAIPTHPSKPTTSSVPEKPNTTTISAAAVSQTNASSTAPKAPIFDVSPPRPIKAVVGPVWKCPSCSMEHPAQTASCSLCHGINPNYKRLSAFEPTPLPSASARIPDVVVEEFSSSKRVAANPTSSQVEPVPFPTSLSSSTTESTSVNPPPLTAAVAPSLFASTNTLPLFGTTSTTTKESTVNIPPVTTSTSFPTITTTPLFGSSSTATPLFGTIPTATQDKPVSTTANNTFSADTSATTVFSSFGSAPSTNSTITPSTSTGSSIIAAAASSPTKVPTSITFGSFGTTPVTVSTAATSISSDKTSLFSFGTSASAPSLTLLSSSTALAVPASASISTTTTTTTLSTTPSLFAFSSGSTAVAPATAASLTLAAPSSTSGFSFPGSFPLVPSASTATTAAATTTTSVASLFGSSASSSSGFSFPSAGTAITTTSSSAPYAFGASSPPKPFAPSVISTSSATPLHSFGATASFGVAPATVDKPASSFPAFGSTSSTPAVFAFGATSNATTNPIQTSVAPSAATSGFAFAPPASAAAPAFGSGPPSFAFGAAPTFSFGSGSAAPAGGSPFQFSAIPSTAANTTFSTSFSAAPAVVAAAVVAPPSLAADNNPFSVGGESGGRRPVLKPKRRTKQ